MANQGEVLYIREDTTVMRDDISFIRDKLATFGSDFGSFRADHGVVQEDMRKVQEGTAHNEEVQRAILENLIGLRADFAEYVAAKRQGEQRKDRAA